VATCFAELAGLSPPQQAQCVRLAAEAVLPLWQSWCRNKGTPDLSGRLLECFDRWLKGDATDTEFDRVGGEFRATLPEDLRVEHDLPGAYAGWAVEIQLIARDLCEDVHYDMVQTSICYAAAAYARVGSEALWGGLTRLTGPELAFLDRWWDRCLERFPHLSCAVQE
jgi:hypothetical protein